MEEVCKKVQVTLAQDTALLLFWERQSRIVFNKFN
jgi:hypothetical protein